MLQPLRLSFCMTLTLSFFLASAVSQKCNEYEIVCGDRCCPLIADEYCDDSKCGENMKCNNLNKCQCVNGFLSYLDKEKNVTLCAFLLPASCGSNEDCGPSAYCSQVGKCVCNDLHDTVIDNKNEPAYCVQSDGNMAAKSPTDPKFECLESYKKCNDQCCSPQSDCENNECVCGKDYKVIKRESNGIHMIDCQKADDHSDFDSSESEIKVVQEDGIYEKDPSIIKTLDKHADNEEETFQGNENRNLVDNENSNNPGPLVQHHSPLDEEKVKHTRDEEPSQQVTESSQTMKEDTDSNIETKKYEDIVKDADQQEETTKREDILGEEIIKDTEISLEKDEGETNFQAVEQTNVVTESGLTEEHNMDSEKHNLINNEKDAREEDNRLKVDPDHEVEILHSEEAFGSKGKENYVFEKVVTDQRGEDEINENISSEELSIENPNSLYEEDDKAVTINFKDEDAENGKMEVTKEINAAQANAEKTNMDDVNETVKGDNVGLEKTAAHTELNAEHSNTNEMQESLSVTESVEVSNNVDNDTMESEKTEKDTEKSEKNNDVENIELFTEGNQKLPAEQKSSQYLNDSEAYNDEAHTDNIKKQVDLEEIKKINKRNKHELSESSDEIENSQLERQDDDSELLSKINEDNNVELRDEKVLYPSQIHQDHVAPRQEITDHHFITEEWVQGEYFPEGLNTINSNDNDNRRKLDVLQPPRQGHPGQTKTSQETDDNHSEKVENNPNHNAHEVPPNVDDDHVQKVIQSNPDLMQSNIEQEYNESSQESSDHHPEKIEHISGLKESQVPPKVNGVASFVVDDEEQSQDINDNHAHNKHLEDKEEETKYEDILEPHYDKPQLPANQGDGQFKEAIRKVKEININYLDEHQTQSPEAQSDVGKFILHNNGIETENSNQENQKESIADFDETQIPTENYEAKQNPYEEKDHDETIKEKQEHREENKKGENNIDEETNLEQVGPEVYIDKKDINDNSKDSDEVQNHEEDSRALAVEEPKQASESAEEKKESENDVSQMENIHVENHDHQDEDDVSPTETGKGGWNKIAETEGASENLSHDENKEEAGEMEVLPSEKKHLDDNSQSVDDIIKMVQKQNPKDVNSQDQNDLEIQAVDGSHENSDATKSNGDDENRATKKLVEMKFSPDSQAKKSSSEEEKHLKSRHQGDTEDTWKSELGKPGYREESEGDNRDKQEEINVENKEIDGERNGAIEKLKSSQARQHDENYSRAKDEKERPQKSGYEGFSEKAFKTENVNAKEKDHGGREELIKHKQEQFHAEKEEIEENENQATENIEEIQSSPETRDENPIKYNEEVFEKSKRKDIGKEDVRHKQEENKVNKKPSNAGGSFIPSFLELFNFDDPIKRMPPNSSSPADFFLGLYNFENFCVEPQHACHKICCGAPAFCDVNFKCQCHQGFASTFTRITKAKICTPLPTKSYVPLDYLAIGIFCMVTAIVVLFVKFCRKTQS